MVVSNTEEVVSIRDFTVRKAPLLPYEKAVKEILPYWSISLVFVGEFRARELNRKLRNKDYTPNVLSYVVSETDSEKKEGEIILCLSVAKKQAASYNLTYEEFVLFLFIHGLLHLDGRHHGSTMEKQEWSFLSHLLAS